MVGNDGKSHTLYLCVVKIIGQITLTVCHVTYIWSWCPTQSPNSTLSSPPLLFPVASWSNHSLDMTCDRDMVVACGEVFLQWDLKNRFHILVKVNTISFFTLVGREFSELIYLSSPSILSCVWSKSLSWLAMRRRYGHCVWSRCF